MSKDFDQTIRRLDHASHMYTAERGSGVAAARTMTLGGTPTIILNGDVVSHCSTDDVERLLAHEGGHVALHVNHESITDWPFKDHCSEGLATLHGVAAASLEEFRIELLMARLGYPIAERASAGSLDEQLFELSFKICTALTDPACANPRVFAKTMIEATQLMVTSLAYLAGAKTGRTQDFDVSQLSAFGAGFWDDVVAPSWSDRLNLYRSIPSAGTRESPARLADLLNRAVDVERKFLSDIGFTITEDERQQGAWSFLRTASDAVFDARIQRLAAEARQRGLIP
ncbi:hypothetical protein [Actinokineospora sp. HUAS TT18]|uniref:hypothetical protein n=1 Tax=Actinokineospora sp. HUAS TT18 TaxID=3447451 RepID=UPI003F5242C7